MKECCSNSHKIKHRKLKLAQENLDEIFLGLVLGQTPSMFHDVVVHISAVAQLQDEIEFGLSVDDLVESDDVGVLNELHASHFLVEMSPRDGVELQLLDHFDSDSLPGENVARELDNREMPFAYGFFQIVEAGDFAFRGFIGADSVFGHGRRRMMAHGCDRRVDNDDRGDDDH